jgi:hypothetical protein
MSELQAVDNTPDEAAQPVEQDESIETVQPGADLATDSPGEGEENTSSNDVDDANADPSGYTKAINKQHLKYREEQRRANALQAELEKFKAEQPKVAEPEIVNIPDIPDHWEPDYQDKIKARDAAIAKNAQANAMRLQQEQMSVQAQRDRELQAEKASKLRVQNWTENAKKLNVSEESLAQAGQAIMDYGIKNELALAIMEDPDGPVIAKFLAANPLELDAINSADPFRRGQMWGKIQAKASALKPAATSAPAPATSVSGGGKVPNQRGPKGATFE